MAKRKAVIKGEDEDDFNPDSTKEEGKLDSDEEHSLSKRLKAGEASPSNASADDIVVHSTSAGEKYVNLGKKKRATVRAYKSTLLLDIREFYGEDGNEKPGKKGVSLNLEQWETLKKSVKAIDTLFSNVKK